MRLLCVTDLLPKSEAAIDRAGLLAAELGASLSLLHVVAPAPSERVLEQTLQNAIGHLRSRTRPPVWREGPAPNVQLRTGNPARLILETLEETKPDLLVMGPHRPRGVRDALEGTIAAKVLSARQCPILIVQREAQTKYRNVFLGLDLSATSEAALRAAESLVLTGDARARIVHACEPPYQGMVHYAGAGISSVAAYAAGWRREAMAAVRDLLKYQSGKFDRYSIQLEEGRAPGALLRAIGRSEPDLLVLGTRGRGRIGRALLGSVANAVLHRAHCDVLVVPAGSFNPKKTRRVPIRRAHASEVLSEVIPGA
jgi:nucleotide-binding universal stress UspA family protein